MSKPQMNDLHIKFVIKGVIVLCIAADKKSFDIGIVKGTGQLGSVIGHDLEMQVWEIHTDGSYTLLREYTHSRLMKEVFLDIANSRVGQLFLFGNPSVDRVNDFDSFDFSWMLDLDNNEMHKDAVTIRPEALRSVLRVSNVGQGVFYTNEVSEKHLVIRDGAGARSFGRVAAVIEALVPIPANGATITHGEDSCPLKEKEGVAFYEVVVKQACNSEEACRMMSLSDIYDSLYDGNGPNGKIHLDGVTERSKIFPFAADIHSGTVALKFGKNSKLPTPE